MIIMHNLSKSDSMVLRFNLVLLRSDDFGYYFGNNGSSFIFFFDCNLDPCNSV